jgi:hypothetical protein
VLATSGRPSGLSWRDGVAQRNASAPPNYGLLAAVLRRRCGDFFGTFREMEQACNDNPKLLYDYYDVLKKEGAARARHRADPAHNAEPDSNGPIMVASALNGRNPMDYLNLAATNFNHFCA